MSADARARCQGLEVIDEKSMPEKCWSTLPAAIRQRRLRDRKRSGAVVVNLENSAPAVACLVRTGLLAPQKRTDANAVRVAFGAFVERALMRSANVARDR